MSFIIAGFHPMTVSDVNGNFQNMVAGTLWSQWPKESQNINVLMIIKIRKPYVYLYSMYPNKPSQMKISQWVKTSL